MCKNTCGKFAVLCEIMNIIGECVRMATTTTLWMLLLLQCGAVLATYYHRSSSESSSSRGYRLPTAASSYKSKNNYYHQTPLRQAAVDVVSKSRMSHNYNDNKLSPLEVLYNKLDSQSQSSSSKQQEFSQKHNSYFSNNGKRDYVASPMLRSAPEHRRHALQLKNEDNYDYVEEDEDVDDNEDDDDEDEDEDDEEEEGEDTDLEGDHHPLRHQKHNHHSESVKLWDGEGFQDQQPSSGQSYSEFKWHIFGKENINNYRNRHRPPNRAPTPENIKRAVDHTLVMNRDGACRVPKPKVVHVKAVYPHPGKAYIPHCTILHQCGDDTGCCRSETQTCTARTTQPVELYFYMQKVGSSGGSSVTSVEKLIFYNHTECSCVDRLEEVMPRDGGNHHHNHHQSNTKPSPDPAQICRCPRMFSERQLADGACTCECFDKQRECIRAKRGKEYLSLQDQMCVVNGQCQPPSCEFGTYKRHAGRCPRKEEKFDVWRAYPHRDEDFK